MFWIVFAFSVGLVVGFFCCALMVVAKQADEQMEMRPGREGK